MTPDGASPPLFQRRPSRVAQIAIYCALSLLLMVLDARFGATGPLRAAAAAALAPLQWLMLQPVLGVQAASAWRGGLQQAQQQARQAREALLRQTRRAWLADELAQENARLRALLQLQQRLDVPGVAAQVLHDSPDPYTRRVLLDRGSVHGIHSGAAVLDDLGVVGQVTRVEPLRAEVTLLTQRNHATPVFNPRSQWHSVAYGDAAANDATRLQLRFVAANADVQPGDILRTSGLDGVYPPGIPVAQVVDVARSPETGFLRVECRPLARLQTLGHVLVLPPAEAMPPAGPPAPKEPA